MFTFQDTVAVAAECDFRVSTYLYRQSAGQPGEKRWIPSRNGDWLSSSAPVKRFGLPTTPSTGCAHSAPTTRVRRPRLSKQQFRRSLNDTSLKLWQRSAPSSQGKTGGISRKQKNLKKSAKISIGEFCTYK